MNTTVSPLQKLVDQEARDRFTQEIDQNFSVIAPAGVGKTTAIVQRILNVANSCNYNLLPSRLSKLVVVTYTQKAADEMRLRSYQALLKANASPQCLQEFNKAFFGTIHSFCLKIIQSYGPQIGISSSASLLTDDEDLWYEFLNENDTFSNLIPSNIKDHLCKHLNLSKLSQLARRIKPELGRNSVLSDCPAPNLHSVFNHTSKRSAQKVLQIQNELRYWLAEYEEDAFALGIPEISQGDSEFKELCAEAFSPLWHWLGNASLDFVIALAKRYQQFRTQKGFINYDDMIGLAAKLLLDPYVITTIQSLDYHVILDEAQDTDSQQFSVLLGVTRSHPTEAPGKGRFCMLGDPQQAIYSSRADLPTYLKLHNDLVDSRAIETLTFNVTMRCDKAIVTHCNAIFPSVLKQKATELSQVDFIPLNPRPSAHEGFVGKILIDLPEGSAKLNTEDLEKHEARMLAQKIHNLGLSGLGIKDWSEVAILAPRKSWLSPIANALQCLDIPTQIHSRDDIKGDNPAVAWLTALLVVTTSPNDSFELVGVLREVFGISDDEIATFVSYWNHEKSSRHPLSIAHPPASLSTPLIKQALDLLYNIRKDSLMLSLSEAVRHIVKEIELINRLASLPQYDSQELLAGLDNILIQAVLAEEQGVTLEEFAQTLKKSYNTQADSEIALKGHVQFYTSHKAKGLEWPVVIVPFLFRSILFPPQEYPQLIATGSDQTVRIAVSDHPDKREWDVLLDQYRIAELERLLYVTATRARNTLLWVDDESLFQNPKNAFATLLKVVSRGTSRQIWNSLNEELPINPNLDEHSLLNNQLLSDQLLSFDPVVLSNSKECSKGTLRRVVPSDLNKKIKLPKVSKTIQQDYCPIEYGNWWHKTMEKLPWHGDQSSWKAHLTMYLSFCPEPSRGETEFQLFLDSPLTKQLGNQSLKIFTEMPFSFREGSSCFEGVIDLVAYEDATGESLIIDWKTDFIEADDALSLVVLKDIYAPQLAVYKQIVERVSKKTPKVFIFSTALGELIEC